MVDDMNAENLPYENNLSNFFMKSSKAVPRIGRRKDLSFKVRTWSNGKIFKQYDSEWNY